MHWRSILLFKAFCFGCASTQLAFSYLLKSESLEKRIGNSPIYLEKARKSYFIERD